MNVDALRAVLLQRAHADAEAIVARARSDAHHSREMTQRRATALVDAARREGELAARREALRDLHAARRQAHDQVLAAEHDAEQRLRDAVLDAVLALRRDPAYPALLDALTRVARQRLGAHVSIVLDPPGRGGIIARDGTRRLDMTLPSLALLALQNAAAPPAPDASGAVA